MSGKPYTIRELKTIVDYVLEHKVYNLTKGKKMWMDFANSQLTNRTWQSLKEAFLKRILPDINNPYFKLTAEQIDSFRRGFDVEERSRSKLEVRKEKSKESSANDEDGEPNIEMKTEVERATGEDVISKTLRACASNRSSTDTVVLEEVYQTAEDIQKVLESPPNENNNEDMNKSPAKSLRDLIVYTEPLTPVLQEVLDDFASESEDESRMQIVEDNEVTSNKTENGGNEKSTDKSDANSEENNDTVNSAYHININKPFRGPDIRNLAEINIDQNDKDESSGLEPIDGTSDCNDVINLCSENDTDELVEAGKVVHNNRPSQEKTIVNSTQNCSNNTTDSDIPNNQEALYADKSLSKTVESTGNTACNGSVKLADDERQKRKSSTSSTGRSESINKTADNAEATKDTNKDKEANVDTDIADKDKSTENINDVLDKLRENSEPKETEEASVDISNKKVQNPCLQSVSLFDENLDIGSVSDCSIVEVSTDQITNVENVLVENVNKKVVVLNSHSESASSNSVLKTNATKPTTKRQRHKAFADLFGFSSGAVSSSHKEKISCRKRKKSCQSVHVDEESGSSEYTSQEDHEDYVTLPRAKKNRIFTKKYLKPNTTPIIPFEHKGGLFTVYYKKVIPLLKDGREIKEFLIYTSESDSEAEQDAYWKKKYSEEKQKYEEERKRTEMLITLLEKAKESKPRAVSPQPANTARKSETRDTVQRKLSSSSASFDKEASTSRDANKKELTETVKVKFTKNNEEIQVEGQWQQVNTVLQQVVQIFHNDNEPRAGTEKKSSPVKAPEEKRPSTSRDTTPNIAIVDNEVSNKVDKIENEIFKQIEQLENEESNENTPVDEFVTKRRGKGRKISTSTVSSSPKKPRVSSQIVINGNNLEEAQPSTSKRNARSLKNSASAPPTKASKEVSVQTRRSRSRKTPSVPDENDVRYMLPPHARKSDAKSDLVSDSKERSKSLRSFAEISSSLDNSMQGYQDSDLSPLANQKRKKSIRRYSHALKTKRRKKELQRSIDIASDSSSSFSGPLRNMSGNSSIYKSDSNRLLMPKKHPFEVLEAIEEDNATSKEISYNKHFNAIHLDQDNVRSNVGISYTKHTPSTNCHSDSSSLISLPTSPVLSVVENISVSKDSFSTLDQSIIKSKVNDVSVPTHINDVLMVTNRQETRKMSIDEIPRRSMSDSILDRINKVNIRDGSVSETIGQRLGDLLLDSAKKISKKSNENMEVDASVADLKKNKAKKRCSTPRKKIRTRFNEMQAVLQEHVETCSSGGRESCPPTICVYDCDDNAMSIENTSPTTDRKKTKKKKDIIKVKILKPRISSKSDRISHSETNLVYKDSGINCMESAVLQAFDDSVEFIHNHSDTCINANECMGDDSVKVVEGDTSVISLNNQSTRSCHTWFGPQPEDLPEDVEEEAQKEPILDELDSGFSINLDKSCHVEIISSNSTQASYNSLLTEDLSDETPVTPETPKLSTWHLLSEDENTNFSNQEHSSAGSNLAKLFPIACAVPDLSTITEMSRENGESSRKATSENCADGSPYSNTKIS